MLLRVWGFLCWFRVPGISESDVLHLCSLQVFAWSFNLSSADEFRILTVPGLGFGLNVYGTAPLNSSSMFLIVGLPFFDIEQLKTPQDKANRFF